MYLRSRNYSCQKDPAIGLGDHIGEADDEWSPMSASSRSCTCALAVSAMERGQTTAEYALVLLAAGSIAMLVVGWAQGNDAIGALFDTVLSRITSLTA
jgi:Flp pilus assembly pilin Flp